MAKPLLDILCTKTEPYCPYPIEMKVTMDDGSIQTYILQNKTEYMFNTVLAGLNNLERMIGYSDIWQRKRRYRVGKHDTVR